jgi:hypothetical protein
VRTGVQIGADLVMTSKRWIGAGTSPASITLSNGTTGGNNVQTHTAAYVTVNDYLPVAIIQTTQTFNTAPVVVDLRSAASLVAARPTTNCYAYATSADFRRAAQRILRGDGGNEYVVGPEPGFSPQLHDRDAGAPCFDATTNTFIGYSLSTIGTESRVVAAGALEFYLSGMRRVAQVRRDSNWVTPYMIQTIAPNGTRMCVDIPWGYPYDYVGVNQFQCNGGGAQRWLLDYSHAGGPALINVQSGTCLEVPGSSAVSGMHLQAHRCHGGANQRWTAQWNTGPGDMLSPLSSPTAWSNGTLRPTLCLAVRGGPSNSSQPVEQATCNRNAAHHDWSFGHSI